MSPSGMGLKWFVPGTNAVEHAKNYEMYSNYCAAKLGKAADISCKDVSRACLLCHDPNVYCNTQYEFRKLHEYYDLPPSPMTAKQNTCTYKANAVYTWGGDVSPFYNYNQ